MIPVIRVSNSTRKSLDKFGGLPKFMGIVPDSVSFKTDDKGRLKLITSGSAKPRKKPWKQHEYL